MEESPKKRICPSLNSVILRKVWRHTEGARNGRMPSMISISAKAMSSVFTVRTGRDARPPRRPPSLAFPEILEVAEELGGRVDHQDVVLAPEGAPVRFH